MVRRPGVAPRVCESLGPPRGGFPFALGRQADGLVRPDPALRAPAVRDPGAISPGVVPGEVGGRVVGAVRLLAPGRPPVAPGGLGEAGIGGAGDGRGSDAEARQGDLVLDARGCSTADFS